MIELSEGLATAVGVEIAAIIAGQKTLEDVVRWALAQSPPRLVEDVVVQDEYTHDVVLRWGEDIFLVYDTT